MIALPIPLFVSLTIGFLLVRSVFNQERWLPFHALLLITGLQGLLISLVHYYGVAPLRGLMPVTASCIPPIAWLAFRAALYRDLSWVDDLRHAAVPAFVLFCLVFAPNTLDQVIPAIFVIYGAAILFVIARTKDAPRAVLSQGPIPILMWRCLGGALILSALSDVLIVIAIALGQPQLLSVIVSSFSSLMLLLIAALSLIPQTAADEPDDLEKPARNTDDDAAIMAKINQVMASEKLFLDPDLTLARIAKRLHLPMKQVSAAINTATGNNVSKLVNEYRINHACDLLKNGQSVTEAIYDSGFNTKSNFNREFLRVAGMAPSKWLEMNARIVQAD